MALNPNDTLANRQYRILRQLGRGGFGFVYQAQDTLLSDEVAIKKLIPELVGDDAMLKRFLAEARVSEPWCTWCEPQGRVRSGIGAEVQAHE